MIQKVGRVVAILLISAVYFALQPPLPVNATTALAGTVTLWLQATDSCKEGLPGASFSLVNASGQAIAAPVTRGAGRETIGSTNGGCPIPQGNCALIDTGCTTWNIPIPGAGSVTYKIVEKTTNATANGITFTENPTGPDGSPLLGFAACTGGAACHSESGTVTVSSAGLMSATVNNVAPDRSVQEYGPFNGTVDDPVLFHNYEIGSDTSDPCVAGAGNVQMNYGTGTEGSHCRYEP
jgi:hypothetical protein